MWLNPLGIFFFFKYSFLFQSPATLITRQQKLPLNKQKKLNNKEQKEIAILYSTLYCSLATKVQ